MPPKLHHTLHVLRDVPKVFHQQRIPSSLRWPNIEKKKTNESIKTGKNKARELTLDVCAGANVDFSL
jgi:hypothetical protein